MLTNSYLPAKVTIDGGYLLNRRPSPGPGVRAGRHEIPKLTESLRRAWCQAMLMQRALRLVRSPRDNVRINRRFDHGHTALADGAPAPTGTTRVDKPMAQYFGKFRIRAVLEQLIPYILFAAIIWIGQYWHSRSFGLYEDDYYRIPAAMEVTSGYHWKNIAATVFHFGGQGRPLHSLFVYGLSFLAVRLGGLEGAYVTGYLIVVANAFLFYLLLKRLSDQDDFALLGGLAFCVFPADTTRAFLTHSLGIQPSLTVLLIAFHLYLSGKVKSSYILVFCSLFIYETVFPVFLAAPLLQNNGSLRITAKLRRHALVLALMVGVVFVLRRAAGEERVAGVGLREAALLLVNPVIGPVTAMAMFVYRPIETMVNVNRGFALMCVVFIAVGGVLTRFVIGRRVHLREALFGQALRAELRWQTSTGASRLLPVAVLMLILAYPFTLTTIGCAVSGRGTRAHMAAVIGASMLFGCISAAIIRAAAVRGKQYLAICAVSAWIALLVGFGLRVQRDYTLSWEFQRVFWADVIRLCPDLTDGTVVFVEPTGLPDNRQFLWLRKELQGVPDTRQIKFFEASHLTLQEIYKFPSVWKNPPMVYRLPLDWRNRILSAGDVLTIDGEVAREGRQSNATVDSSNAILLETENNKVSRRREPIVLSGHQVSLKAQTHSTQEVLKKGPLYDYLVRDTDKQSSNDLDMTNHRGATASAAGLESQVR